MNGVGGNQQPVNLTTTNNNTRTQNTQTTQGPFGRFKVSLTNALKSFFTGTSPSQVRTVTIHSRTVTPAPAPVKSNAADKKPANVANTLDAARNDPAAKQRFEQVHKYMEEIQSLKKIVQQFRSKKRPASDQARRAINIEMRVTKAKCQAAIDNFNKTVGPDLQINFNDLEMALGNKAQLEAGLNYPEFHQEFQAYSNYNAMKNTWLK